VVDLFMGQLRSCLQWDCGRTSVVFDSYSCLSLPLPKRKSRYIEVTVIFQDPARTPTRYSAEVGEHMRLRDVVAEVSRLSGVKERQLFLAEMSLSYHAVNTFPFLSTYIRDFFHRGPDILYAYEVPALRSTAAAIAAPAAVAASGGQGVATSDVAGTDTETTVDPLANEHNSSQATLRVLHLGDRWDVQDTVGKWLPGEVIGVHWYSDPKPILLPRAAAPAAVLPATIPPPAGTAVATSAAAVATADAGPAGAEAVSSTQASSTATGTTAAVDAAGTTSPTPAPAASVTDTAVSPSATSSSSVVTAAPTNPSEASASGSTAAASSTSTTAAAEPAVDTAALEAAARAAAKAAAQAPGRANAKGQRGRVLIHYVGWNSRWDEWIDMDSDRILPYVLNLYVSVQG